MKNEYPTNRDVYETKLWVLLSETTGRCFSTEEEGNPEGGAEDGRGGYPREIGRASCRERV